MVKLTEPTAFNRSVQSTGSFLVPLYHGNGLYACHLNLAEPTRHGDSMSSPNFNIRPNLADTPITWNSKSDSGPTTTTVTTSTSAPPSVLTRVATFTMTTAATFASRAAVNVVTSTYLSSPLPSSTSSPSQSSHLSVGVIVGASIAGLIGISSLIVATLLYVRTRSRRRREAQDQAPNRGGDHRNLPELTGLSITEVDGQPNLDRGLYGYPVAVGHHLPVGELEGRR